MKKLIAAIAVLILPACGGGDDTKPEAQKAPISSAASELTDKYIAMRDAAFVMADGEDISVDDVAALLPDDVLLSVGSASFDAASGATVWKNVKITGSSNSSVGVTADEVKLWGLDTAAIEARIAGTNNDQTVTLAERVEAKGVKTIGFERMMTEFMVNYVEGVSNTVEAAMPEDGLSDEELAEMRAAMEMVIDTYALEVGHLVAIKPKMRPWEIARIDIDAVVDSQQRDKAALFFFQDMAAYYRTLGVEHLIWSDTTFSMLMEQDGIKQDATGGYEFVAYSGLNGGDTERAVMTGMHMKQDMDMSEMMAQDGLSADDIPGALQSMQMSFEIGTSTFEGMKFDKVLRYIALGDWPPTSDTDLMSYGQLQVNDMTMAFNDAPTMEIENLSLDLTDWHWLIPEEARISIAGLKYDIDGLFTMIGAGMGPGNEDELAQMTQVLDIMRKYEAIPIMGDVAYEWDWNPQTGAFQFSSPQTHRNFGRAEFELSGFLPNFEDGVAAVKVDLAYEPDPDIDLDVDPFQFYTRKSAWDLLFEEKVSLTGGLLVLEDQGGLDKIFPMISEIGKLDPDAFGPMMANSTPEALRGMAVSSVGMAAIEAGKEMPEAKQWLMAFSDWVRDGGTFRLTFNPSEPLGQALTEKYPDPTPEKMAELLGVTVTHAKP